MAAKSVCSLSVRLDGKGAKANERQDRRRPDGEGDCVGRLTAAQATEHGLLSCLCLGLWLCSWWLGSLWVPTTEAGPVTRTLPSLAKPSRQARAIGYARWWGPRLSIRTMSLSCSQLTLLLTVHAKAMRRCEQAQMAAANSKTRTHLHHPWSGATIYLGRRIRSTMILTFQSRALETGRIATTKKATVVMGRPGFRQLGARLSRAYRKLSRASHVRMIRMFCSSQCCS